jgi:hypothetical protein
LAFLALPPAIFAALTAISSSAFSGERKRGIGRLKPAAIWKMPDHNNNLRQAARGGTKMKAILRVFSFFVFASLVISLAPPHQLNPVAQTLAPSSRAELHLALQGNSHQVPVRFFSKLSGVHFI